MPLDDENIEKWEMKEHTEVKHRILRKYLSIWTRILGSTNREVQYFDGFAGRGRYKDGEAGSPLLAIDVADSHIDQLNMFHCTLNELNSTNFGVLKEEVAKKKQQCAHSERINTEFHNRKFEDIALDVLTNEDYRHLPSLVFVDPFGYKGTPFETISDIMNIRDSGDEVFFNFMVDKIRRFVNDEEKANTITRAFGTDKWKYIRDIDNRQQQEKELLQFYVSRLREDAGVKHVFPFQMKHPDKDVTVYYLIFATNHFKGLRVMKDVMFDEGDDDLFAYLGPDHYKYENEQMTLFDATNTNGGDDRKTREFADHLHNQFEGMKMRYEDLIKYTYTSTDLVERHCRNALQYLERCDKVVSQKTGPQGGYKEEKSLFDFSQQNQRLGDFLD